MMTVSTTARAMSMSTASLSSTETARKLFMGDILFMEVAGCCLSRFSFFLVQFFIGIYYVLDQAVSHHILLAEKDKADALYVL